jgi:branched-chain amino acid transport system ATP-binding protein
MPAPGPGVLGAVIRGARTRAEEAAIHDKARELMDYVGLKNKGRGLAGHLPYGDQRRLEIARALATEPRLLALDEPVAGMNPPNGPDGRAVPQAARGRRHPVADRARREAGDGLVRSPGGAGLRPQDRRGRARGVQKDDAVIAAYLGGEAA